MTLAPGAEKLVRREIGARLRAARTANHMSQEAAAAALKKDRRAVSRWELGRTQPIMMELIELAVLYGESLDWLLLGLRTRPLGGASLQEIFRERDAAQAEWPWGL